MGGGVRVGVGDACTLTEAELFQTEGERLPHALLELLHALLELREADVELLVEPLLALRGRGDGLGWQNGRANEFFPSRL